MQKTDLKTPSDKLLPQDAQQAVPRGWHEAEPRSSYYSRPLNSSISYGSEAQSGFGPCSTVRHRSRLSAEIAALHPCRRHQWQRIGLRYLEKYYCAEGLVGPTSLTCHFRERIRVGGKPISAPRSNKSRTYKSSFTGSLPIATHRFSSSHCDGFAFCHHALRIGLWETGLGGRLIPISQPLCSVITDIGMDHQEWLGSSLTSIASEKRASSAHTPVVLGTLSLRLKPSWSINARSWTALATRLRRHLCHRP